MGIYKDYPTFGINIDDINDIVKIIKPQGSINFSGINGNIPAVSNGSLSMDPCEIVDIGAFIDDGAAGTISNGRFGSSENAMGFVFASFGVIGSGFYVRASILPPATPWSIILSVSDPLSETGGYFLNIDSSTNTMNLGKVSAQQEFESLSIKKIDSAKANSPKEILFQWDGIRRFKATFGSTVITAVNDDYNIEQHIFGIIVNGNILNSFEAGASEYFDNFDPNGPDRGVSLANVSLSNPNVVWPGDDNAASLNNITEIAASESLLSPFITIDSAGPYFSNQFPGDIEPGEIRVGIAGYPNQDINEKYETGDHLGVNVHTVLGTPSSTPMYELPLIEDIYDLASADIALSRVPAFSLLVEDITDTAQLEADFDEIISILESVDSGATPSGYSWITIVPLSEENLSDVEDWIAAQLLFRERLRISESLKIAFFPSVNIKIIEDFQNILNLGTELDDVWDFIGIYSIIDTFQQGDVELIDNWSNLLSVIADKNKKVLFIESFTPNTAPFAATYIDYQYNTFLSNSEPQFIGYIYADNIYELQKVNYEDTLTGSPPSPEDFPAPPNGALQYVVYDIDNSAITDISVDFKINSNMNAAESTYFQFYESDIGIDHQYFGVQTDAPLDSSLQLLIFSKFIDAGATPAREGDYDEIRTVDMQAYPVLGDNEGNFTSLRCPIEITVGDWHNVTIERAEYEVLDIGATPLEGYWFNYYFDNQLIGGLWFEVDPSGEVYFTNDGATFTEYWPNNNNIELLPVPELEFFIKPIKFNNAYDYTTVLSVYSQMPNSDTTYIASENPYDGYLRLRFGGDTARVHDDNEIIDVTVSPTMVNSQAIDKWIEITNLVESVDLTQGTTLGVYEAPYGSAADDFADLLKPLILSTSFTDIIVWRDMIGMDSIEKYFDLYQSIIDKFGFSYKYYAPNIDISGRNEGHDSSLQLTEDFSVIVDIRYFGFFLEFINTIGSSSIYNDGVAFSGNFTAEEWPYIIDYVKSITDKKLVITRMDNESNKDSVDTENEKIAAMVNSLEDSDIVFIPGYVNSFFSIPDPSYAGYNWLFSAQLNIPSPGALNASIKFPSYSEEILGTPTVTITGDNISITELVPLSGGILSIGNLPEDTYTISLFGDTLSAGSASLRIVFDADNFDEVSISDTIYLEY